ncbi:MAG: hypothetical protein HWD82_10700 [Flavobacteriaceae bacterium]|nr:hypothetical protein [Flavobacteriaceae bacterium]
MGFITKETLLGVCLSILATLAGGFFYIEFFSKLGFKETIVMIEEAKLYGKILSIAAIPNLFVFLVLIKKKQDYRAKGVLITTILIALTTFVLKYIA